MALPSVRMQGERGSSVATGSPDPLVLDEQELHQRAQRESFVRYGLGPHLRW